MLSRPEDCLIYLEKAGLMKNEEDKKTNTAFVNAEKFKNTLYYLEYVLEIFAKTKFLTQQNFNVIMNIMNKHASDIFNLHKGIYVLLPDLLTQENFATICKNLFYADCIAHGLKCFERRGMLTTEYRDLVVQHAADSNVLTYGLMYLIDNNLFTPENKAYLIANSGKAKDLAIIINYLNKAGIYTPDNCSLLDSIEFLSGLESVLRLFQSSNVAGLVNQQNFEAIIVNYAHNFELYDYFKALKQLQKLDQNAINFGFANATRAKALARTAENEYMAITNGIKQLGIYAEIKNYKKPEDVSVSNTNTLAMFKPGNR